MNCKHNWLPMYVPLHGWVEWCENCQAGGLMAIKAEIGGAV